MNQINSEPVDLVLPDTPVVTQLLRDFNSKLHAVLGDMDGVLDRENDAAEIINWGFGQLVLARDLLIQIKTQLVDPRTLAPKVPALSELQQRVNLDDLGIGFGEKQ
jgi:hypothetical protein